MAKTKSGGKSVQQQPQTGKRLGLKVSGGESVKTGMIVVRQRGTKFHPGDGVGVGRDHTLFALRSGKVMFKKLLGKKLIYIAKN